VTTHVDVVGGVLRQRAASHVNVRRRTLTHVNARRRTLTQFANLFIIC